MAKADPVWMQAFSAVTAKLEEVTEPLTPQQSLKLLAELIEDLRSRHVDLTDEVEMDAEEEADEDDFDKRGASDE